MADDKAIQFANKQRIKDDLFIKFLDNHDAIYSNVKEYFASEGEQNSLYPIYQKMFSQNPSKARRVFGTLDKEVIDAQSAKRQQMQDEYKMLSIKPSAKEYEEEIQQNLKSVEQQTVNRFINRKPAEVVTVGIIDALASASASKAANGKGQEMLDFIGGYVEDLTYQYDWKTKDKDQRKAIQSTFGDLINKSVVPVKARENIFQFRPFGEDVAEYPVVAFDRSTEQADGVLHDADAFLQRSKSSFKDMIWEVGLANKAADYSGITTDKKYDYKLQTVLEQTGASDWKGTPLRHDGTPLAEGEVWEPFIKTSKADQLAPMFGSIGGMIAGTMLDQLLIAGITAGTTAVTGVGGVATGVIGETAAVGKFAYRAKKLYDLGSNSLKSVKILQKTKPFFLNNAKYAKQAFSMSMAQTISEAGTQGVGTTGSTLIGNDEMEAKESMLAAEWIQNFVSATIANYGGDMVGKLVGNAWKLNKAKSSKQFIDMLEKSGFDRVEALAGLSKVKVMTDESIKRFVDSGGISAKTTAQVSNALRYAFKENATKTAIRNISSGWLGKTGVEIGVDAVFDFATITGGNYIGREYGDGNIFAANTTYMGDLSNDIPLMDQLKTYATNQGLMRLTGASAGKIGSFAKGVAFGKLPSVTRSVGQMKEYFGMNADEPVPVGLSVNAVRNTTLIKAASNKMYEDLVKDFKFDENETTALIERSLIKSMANRMTVSRIAEDNLKDSQDGSLISEAEKAVSAAVYDADELSGRLSVKSLGNERKAFFDKLSDFVVKESVIGENDAVAIDKNLLTSNVNTLFTEMNISGKQAGEILEGILNKTKEYSADAGIRNTIAGFFEGKSVKSTTPAKIGRKSLLNEFSEDLVPFDPEQVILQNMKTLNILEKVDLGITAEVKSAVSGLIKQTTAQAQTDIAIRTVMESTSINRFNSATKIILEKYKLSENDKSIITDIRKLVAGSEDKHAGLEAAKEQLRQKTDVFAPGSYSKAIAVNKTIDDYMYANANDIVQKVVLSKPIEQFSKDDISKIVNYTNILKPFLKDELVQAVDGLNSVNLEQFDDISMKDNVAPVSPVRVSSAHEVLYPKIQVTSWTLKSIGSKYGFEALPERLFDVTIKNEKGNIQLGTKDRSNDAMEFVMKSIMFSEEHLSGVLSTAAIKQMAFDLNEMGSIDKNIPMFDIKEKDKAGFVYANIKGTLKEGDMSNITVSFKKRMDADIHTIDLATLKPEDDSPAYLSTLTNPLEQDGVEVASNASNKRNATDFVMNTMRLAVDFNQEAEAYRAKIDFNKWTFGIGEDVYTLKKFKSELDFMLAPEGVTVNKAIRNLLTATRSVDETVERVIRLYKTMAVDENGKPMDIDIETEKLINIACKQLVVEQSVKHGLYQKLEISDRGDIRGWDIRPNIVNSYHNNRVCEIDIEFDLESAIDKVYEKKLKDFDKEFADVPYTDRPARPSKSDIEIEEEKKLDQMLIDKGLVRLPIGFGNNLKTKWLYMPDFGNVKNDIQNLKDLLKESIKERSAISLYPEGDNVYAKMLNRKEPENLSHAKYFTQAFTEIITHQKNALTDRIAKFNEKYADVVSAHTDSNGKVRGVTIKPEGIEIDPYSKHTEELLKSKDMTNDVIVEMYNGMKDSMANLEKSMEAVNKITELYKAMDLADRDEPSINKLRHYLRSLVGRFALYGAETFSISTPAKRGSFKLLSNKIDNSTSTASIAPELQKVIDKFESGEMRIIFAQSRTQDGMSWMPEALNSALRAVFNSFDIKYTNQSIGSKLMTTDTRMIAGQKLLSQLSDEPITVRPTDFVIEFGSIKGYTSDLAEMILKSVPKAFKGNAIVLDVNSMSNADKRAVGQLLGNITTHAVLTTNTKDGKISTQPENTTRSNTDILHNTYLNVAKSNASKIRTLLYGVKLEDAFVNPAMHLREVSAAFAEYTVPSATAPAEVIQKLRDNDTALTTDDDVPFQVVIGTKALSVDMQYFLTKDKYGKGVSGTIGKIADWLAHISLDSKPTEEELTSIKSAIKDIDPKFQLKPGVQGVTEWVMDFLSNERLPNKSGRMYAKVGSEYFSIGNRSPIVYGGQQDYFLVRGIRTGGHGVEMSADAYSKIEGGDYDGDTVGRIMTTLGVIRKTVGEKGFKELISKRQKDAIAEAKFIQSVFGGVKPPSDYFNGKETLHNVDIAQHLGKLKNFQHMVYLLDMPEAMSNPNSPDYVYNKMFLHPYQGSEFKDNLQSTLADPVDILDKPSSIGKTENGEIAFYTKTVNYNKLNSEWKPQEILVVISDKKGMSATVDIYPALEARDFRIGDLKKRNTYNLSSIRGMNHIIQSMSVSNVKTFSVQYFNEQLREMDNNLNEDPHRYVAEYIKNISYFTKENSDPMFDRKANGKLLGINMRRIKRISDAFSPDNVLSVKDLSSVIKDLEWALDLPSKDMPASVSMAVEKWKAMKEMGLDRAFQTMAVNMDEVMMKQWHTKDFIGMKTTLGSIQAEFPDVKNASELQDVVIRDLVGSGLSIEQISTVFNKFITTVKKEKIVETKKAALHSDFWREFNYSKNKDRFVSRNGKGFDVSERVKDDPMFLANELYGLRGVPLEMQSMSLPRDIFNDLITSCDGQTRAYFAHRFIKNYEVSNDYRKAFNGMIGEILEIKGYKSVAKVPSKDVAVNITVKELLTELTNSSTANNRPNTLVLKAILNNMSGRSKVVHDVLAGNAMLSNMMKQEIADRQSEVYDILNDKKTVDELPDGETVGKQKIIDIDAKFPKDQAKANVADGIIAYGSHSSGKYAEKFGGTRVSFTVGETIMISVNGNNRPNQTENVAKTKAAIDLAINSGVNRFVADIEKNANSSHNSGGEGEIRKYLLSKGLEYNEDGLVGTYTIKPQEVKPSEVSIIYNNNLSLTNKDGSLRLANTSYDADGKTYTITVGKVSSVDSFFKYLSGESGETSKQKGKVIEEIAKDGYTNDVLQSIIKTTDDAEKFLLYHEESHANNRDNLVYWKNGRDLMTPDKIAIEVRATKDALEKISKPSDDAEGKSESIPPWETNTKIPDDIRLLSDEFNDEDYC